MIRPRSSGHRVLSLDLSGVQDPAQAAVRSASDAYVRHLGPDLVSLVVHGSAVRGGFIPGSSDVDFALFLRPGALTVGGQLPLPRAAGLHEELTRVDPSPFRYLQAYAYSSGDPSGKTFIPGTFHVIFGERNVPLATVDELMAGAHRALQSLDTQSIAMRISRKLLSHVRRESGLHNELRLLCTDVWPTLYHVLSVRGGDPIRVWQLAKHQAVVGLETEGEVGQTAQAFYDVVTRHYAEGEAPRSALEAMQAGLAFLEAAARWYQARI